MKSNLLVEKRTELDSSIELFNVIKDCTNSAQKIKISANDSYIYTDTSDSVLFIHNKYRIAFDKVSKEILFGDGKYNFISLIMESDSVDIFFRPSRTKFRIKYANFNETDIFMQDCSGKFDIRCSYENFFSVVNYFKELSTDKVKMR